MQTFAAVLLQLNLFYSGAVLRSYTVPENVSQIIYSIKSIKLHLDTLPHILQTELKKELIHQ